MTSVRLAAARALLAIDSREGTLGSVLDEARRPGADPRDAGLLTELTAGVLRWRNELDAVIAAAGRRSVRGIDAPVLAVLRVGAYQLRHLDRVPDHAVVHESVEAVRALGAASAAGFVNAVLRAIIRRGPAIALPPRPTSGRIDAQVNYLSITLSHPAWLVRRWIERLGFDAAEARVLIAQVAKAGHQQPLVRRNARLICPHARIPGRAGGHAALEGDALA